MPSYFFHNFYDIQHCRIGKTALKRQFKQESLFPGGIMAAGLGIPLPTLFGYWKENVRTKNFWKAITQRF